MTDKPTEPVASTCWPCRQLIASGHHRGCPCECHKPVAEQTSGDYCSYCHKVVIPPNGIYGIHPDAVCQCPKPTPLPQAAVERTLHDRISREIFKCRMGDSITCDRVAEALMPIIAAAQAPEPSAAGTPEYRCFFCGDVFTDDKQAAEHFGSDMYESATPLCVDPLRGDEKARMSAIAQMREEVTRVEKERDEFEIDSDNWHAEQSEMERLFGEGVRTAHHAWFRLEAAQNLAEAYRLKLDAPVPSPTRPPVETEAIEETLRHQARTSHYPGVRERAEVGLQQLATLLQRLKEAEG